MYSDRTDLEVSSGVSKIQGENPFYESPLRYWWGTESYERNAELFRPMRKLSARREHPKLVELAQAELWVRERSGNNDGDRVAEYLKSVGLLPGNPWCAAFVSWLHQQAGYELPRTGWSPALFPVQRLVRAAAPGNVFGIYFPALKRIGHCGIVERLDGDWLTGIEGNTNGSGGREGDGVYRRKRHKRTIYRYSDWRKQL